MNSKAQSEILVSLTSMIGHISNKEYQIATWINGNGADLDEFTCQFLELAEPILDDYKDYGLSTLQCKALRNLIHEFEQFIDRNENYLPENFIDSPEWKSIMNLAAHTLSIFSSLFS